MEVTIYSQPHGRTQVVDIPNVLPDDAAYFQRNNISISMEEVGGTFAIYADYGKRTDDGEPDELIEISSGRSCEETLHALRLECEATIAAA